MSNEANNQDPLMVMPDDGLSVRSSLGLPEHAEISFQTSGDEGGFSLLKIQQDRGCMDFRISSKKGEVLFDSETAFPPGSGLILEVTTRGDWETDGMCLALIEVGDRIRQICHKTPNEVAIMKLKKEIIEREQKIISLEQIAE